MREARRAAGLRVRAKSIGCRSIPNSGLASSTICSHLICPSSLFLMTITLTGSLYFTSVAISPISMVKPPSPDHADYLPARIGHRSSNRVREPVGHRGQHAREGELHIAAHFNVACRPGRDGAAVGDHDRIVIQQLIQLVRDHLRLHRHIGSRAAFLHKLVPGLHTALRLFEKAAVVFSRYELRQQVQARRRSHRPGRRPRWFAARFASDRCRSGSALPGRASARTRCMGKLVPP